MLKASDPHKQTTKDYRHLKKFSNTKDGNQNRSEWIMMESECARRIKNCLLVIWPERERYSYFKKITMP